jgi:hypothetical protein
MSVGQTFILPFIRVHLNAALNSSSCLSRCARLWPSVLFCWPRNIAAFAIPRSFTQTATLQFGTEDVIQVVIEEQPHWPTRNAMTNAESKAMLICDFAHGTRRVWRMVLPDGTPFAVAHHETKSEGLKQAFPPDLLPEVESGKK